jgi:hypothetical protein
MDTFVKQQVVKGVTFFEGTMDDGKVVKSGTAYIEAQLDESNGRSKGFRTVEYKCTPEVVKKVIHLEFPINAEVTFVMKVTKNANVIGIEDIKPLSRAGANPAAKAA